MAPPCPARSSSFKISENHSIEKPNQPPPQVPSRSHLLKNTSESIQQHVESVLPPIGFVVEIPYSNSPLSGQNNPQSDFLKNKENFAQISAASTDTGNSLHAKPPKPTLPRRTGNHIATFLNKFEKKSEEETNDDKQGDRSSSEVTSL